jgi:hypothetical protein
MAIRASKAEIKEKEVTEIAQKLTVLNISVGDKNFEGEGVVPNFCGVGARVEGDAPNWRTGGQANYQWGVKIFLYFLNIFRKIKHLLVTKIQKVTPKIIIKIHKIIFLNQLRHQKLNLTVIYYL